MLTASTDTKDWSKNWQAKIAVRITSIVLWSLTFFSMVFAGLLISQVKDKTIETQNMMVDHLSLNIIQQLSIDPKLDLNMFSDLTATVLENKEYESIEIQCENQSAFFGTTRLSTQALIRELGSPYDIKISVNIRPLKQTVRKKQIQIFMIFGVSLVIFGGFLGIIIDKYVHKPFKRLESATQNFTSGNNQSRVNIKTKDEFGILAAFMNEMFDQITKHETQLKTEVNERNIAAKKVSEQRDALQKLTSELTIARDHAFEASNAKSSFLANMSHELRTPLTTIIGYSELLIEEMEKSEDSNTAMDSDLNKIHHAGKHLLILINGVLDIAKIEAGKMTLTPENFDIKTIIEDVSNMIEPICQESQNHFNIEMNDNMGTMYSDITRVKQILFNLLSNACKFTHNGKIKLIVGKNSHEQITFTVSDTGIGIEKDKINELFNEFVQVDNSTTRKYSGTGLGLSICRRLTTLLGGDITVESEPESGSSFMLTLPIKLSNHQNKK